jgi:Helicase conserved C-terminal domain
VTAVSPFNFSEEDVQTWCDPGIFARADELQNAGHVLAPTVTGTQMTAEVLGTWSRMDRPSIEPEGARLQFRCTCNASTLCRHVIAMVLQWTRKPDAFRNAPAKRTALPWGAAQRDLAPEEQMSQLLHRYTMNDLRALAKRRGLTVKGQLKEEYVQRLAALLLEPENIAPAVEGLGDGELMLLTLIDLLRGGTDSNPAGIRNAFHALWGRRHTDRGDGNRTGLETGLNRLESMGLVFSSSYPGGNYDAPREVAARTRVPQALLELLPDHSAAATGAEMSREGHVTLVDLIQMLAHEVRGGKVRVQVPPTHERSYGRPPQGWEIGERADGRQVKGKGKNIPASVQLLPQPPIIRKEDVKRLAGLTGATPEQIELASDLMEELDILQPAEAARGAEALNSQRLSSLLTLDAVARSRMLSAAWLALSEASDLRLLRGILDLRMDVNQLHWYASEVPAEKSLRVLAARIVGHLAAAPPRWYACSDLANVCEIIAPARLYRAQYALNVWWFTPAGQPDAPLRLDAQDGRREVFRAILGALLRGPLRWLALVDVAETDGDVLFRPRSVAAILADRDPDASGEEAGTVSLVVEAEQDGTPIVSISLSGDDEVALLLTAVAEPLPPSAQGVRYRVTGQALQRIFEIGITGTGLIAWMERWSKSRVPENVRRRIECASESFGTVRLYDDLTLMELGDDFLLRELDAVADLRDMTIHVFSPRLLAVDAEQSPALLASLTKAGYRPRLLDEA